MRNFEKRTTYQEIVFGLGVSISIFIFWLWLMYPYFWFVYLCGGSVLTSFVAYLLGYKFFPLTELEKEKKLLHVMQLEIHRLLHLDLRQGTRRHEPTIMSLKAAKAEVEARIAQLSQADGGSPSLASRLIEESKRREARFRSQPYLTDLPVVPGRSDDLPADD